MTPTRRDLEQSARRRGIRIVPADIPLDGLWHAPDRLILIRAGIDPDSPRYAEVVAHELSHAGADDVHETLDGPQAVTASRAHTTTQQPAGHRAATAAAAAAGVLAVVAAAAAVAALTVTPLPGPGAPPAPDRRPQTGTAAPDAGHTTAPPRPVPRRRGRATAATTGAPSPAVPPRLRPLGQSPSRPQPTTHPAPPPGQLVPALATPPEPVCELLPDDVC